jgi:CRISPR-associated protein Cas5d
MLDNKVVSVKISGDFACFTRPDLKVERMTYPCMTPSAARGILDCILWKPEFQWYVRRILVLKAIKFFSIKRNELTAKYGEYPIVIDELDNRDKPKYRTQRNSIILKDVAYIIEASIYQRSLDRKNLPQKYIDIFNRRVRKGQCFRRPYLGTREFSAEFSEPDQSDTPIPGVIPIGSMLFDLIYDESGKPSPLYFYDVAIVNGILECPAEENEVLMQSSHLQPPTGSGFSASIYAFNQQEEMVIQNA